VLVLIAVRFLAKWRRRESNPQTQNHKQRTAHELQQSSDAQSAPGQRLEHLDSRLVSSADILDEQLSLDSIAFRTIARAWTNLPQQERDAIAAIVACFPEAVEECQQDTPTRSSSSSSSVNHSTF